MNRLFPLILLIASLFVSSCFSLNGTEVVKDSQAVDIKKNELANGAAIFQDYNYEELDPLYVSIIKSNNYDIADGIISIKKGDDLRAFSLYNPKSFSSISCRIKPNNGIRISIGTQMGNVNDDAPNIDTQVFLSEIGIQVVTMGSDKHEILYNVSKGVQEHWILLEVMKIDNYVVIYVDGTEVSRTDILEQDFRSFRAYFWGKTHTSIDMDYLIVK